MHPLLKKMDLLIILCWFVFYLFILFLNRNLFLDSCEL
jgi:hypothetical protein